MIRQLYRRARLSRNLIAVLICCFTMNFGIGGISYAQQPGPAPATEKKDLVKQGVSLYKAGKIDEAKAVLEKAKSVYSDNYAVPYYLGLIYLEKGQKSAAVSEWQQYLFLDSNSENSLRIRKNLTLLHQEKAREQARDALALEGKIKNPKLLDNFVAVTAVRNLSSESLGPFGKGMAVMLIRDLSQISGTQVVDWTSLQAMLKEMQAPKNSSMDPKSAARLGKLLKVKYVTTGEMVKQGEDQLQVKMSVVDAGGKKGGAVRTYQGSLDKFYDLEKQAACGIASDIGNPCEKAPPGFFKTQTRNLKAMISFSWGLDFVDDQEYDEARVMFEQALSEDPNFEMAQEALMATPYTGMRYWTPQQMVAETASHGLAAETAASATAGTVVNPPSAAQAQAEQPEAASGGGMSRGTKIAIGGAALIGLAAVAMGAGGGGGGGDSGTPTPPPADLRGNWEGGWDGAQTGSLNFTLAQNNGNITGQATVTGGNCIASGSIGGTVTANNIVFIIASGNTTGSVTAQYSKPNMQGQITFKGGACDGITGNFSAAITTGGADVSW